MATERRGARWLLGLFAGALVLNTVVMTVVWNRVRGGAWSSPQLSGVRPYLIVWRDGGAAWVSHRLGLYLDASTAAEVVLVGLVLLTTLAVRWRSRRVA